jgi:hypothetical protein
VVTLLSLLASFLEPLVDLFSLTFVVTTELNLLILDLEFVDGIVVASN